MTLKPDFDYEFDVYRIKLSEETGHTVMDIVDVISWNNVRIRMTRSELQGLSDTINQYLSD